MLTEQQQKDALRYALFQDDFGSPGDRFLEDQIAKARVGSTCCECLNYITPGQHTRRVCAIFDGQLRRYRFCEACCAAMASAQKDGGKALEVRSAVRRNNETAL